MNPYQLFEMVSATLSPYRMAADWTRLCYQSPVNPLSYTHVGRSIAAGCEVFERSTRRYSKPEWRIEATIINGQRVPIHPQVVWEQPFCRLLHFERSRLDLQRHPKLLIVAPMSGHHATLLRGTVEAFLPNHDIFITDWLDARLVPLAAGSFDLDDYIDYLVTMLHVLGGDTHVLAVCQPSVPVFAATALMEAVNDAYMPLSTILMGGPIDTRSNPTAVNRLADNKDIEWFNRHVISTVPFPNPGYGRRVYPGFLQLTGFMTMNLDRHADAQRDLFLHLVQGDGDSVAKHRAFYDEYLAVMDLTAEFYLQTVDTVFIKNALALGAMSHRGEVVDPGMIRRGALMTIEGEKDDVTGGRQTEAAHQLATGLPAERKRHYTQPGVGHYGVFNGYRFRTEIAPRISDFIIANDCPRNTTTKRFSHRTIEAFGLSGKHDPKVAS